MVTWVIDIITDPNCSRNTGIYLAAAQALMLPWPWWQHRPPRSIWLWWHQNPQTPTWSQISGGFPDPEQLLRSWWQQNPQTLTQVLNTGGPQTQTLPMAATWARMTLWSHVTRQICIALVTAQSPDTNVATGCDPNPGHPCGLWWYHGPWTSTQIFTVVEPQTQTLSSVAAWTWMSR